MYIRSLTQNSIGYLVLVLAGLSVALTTEATLVQPGGKISLHAAHEPQGAHLLAVTNFNFSAANLTGKLQSKVWADDESNPFGGLTFSYRLVNTGECEDFLGWFSLSGFAGLGVDVNFFGGGVAPRTAIRSQSGDSISFGFFDRGANETFEPGDSSAWLIVQTSAQNWGVNPFVGVDAETASAAAFAPVTVPEPAIVTLVALAGVTVLSSRKKA